MVHNDILNETPLTVLDEQRGFKNNYLSDIPEMMNSGDGELSFLAEDENTSAGSQGGTPDFTKNQSRASEVDMLSVRSTAVAKFLKSRLSVTPISGRQSEDLSLNKILEGKRRKVSARMVFETLAGVLRSLAQEEAEQEEEPEEPGDSQQSRRSVFDRIGAKGKNNQKDHSNKKETEAAKQKKLEEMIEQIKKKMDKDSGMEVGETLTPFSHSLEAIPRQRNLEHYNFDSFDGLEDPEDT
ncbi:hypothetical protein AgCh_024814 [Apium graveolens]